MNNSETVKKIRVRDLVRNEFVRLASTGILGAEGEGTTTLRKHLLAYVVECGGARNSGPAEYNTVQHELIAAGFLTKLRRGKLTLADASAVTTAVETAEVVAETVEVETAAEDIQPEDTMAWLLINKETGAVEGGASSKNKAYAMKSPEQTVRKAETVA